MNKEPLILIGGGGHCRSCIDVIESAKSFDIKAIVDTPTKRGEKCLNYFINHTDEDLPELVKKYKNVLITLGQIKSADLRISYYEKLKNLGAIFPVIISPLAYVSKHSFIDEGTIVLHHALVNSNARVGKNCIINTKALIEHDVVIGDHCHVSTGAIINGSSKLGSKSFLGSQSVSIESIEIPDLSVIGAGQKVGRNYEQK
jgi:sugar O-acyltransferase (sialic acid O-acetyltransferase NeuD family)